MSGEPARPSEASHTSASVRAADSDPPIRIVTVCTHNRARSVAMTALLSAALGERSVPAVVSGVGFMPSGLPPTPQMAHVLTERGLDVRHVRSTRIDAHMINDADLILTAERAHVIRVSEDDSAVFARTFTLPEFVDLAERFGPRRQWPLDRWIGALSVGRSQATFLHGRVGQITDPTGMSLDVHRAAVADIQHLCQRLAVLL